MLSPKPAGTSGKTTPIRVNPDMIGLLRNRMLEKLEPRLRVETTVNGQPRFADANFVRRVGRGLEKISDSFLIQVALMTLDVQMRGEPLGKCGIPLIDNLTPGDHFGDAKPDSD